MSNSRYTPKPYLLKGPRSECYPRYTPTLRQIEAIDAICNEIIFREGDRIDLIAADHYGDARLWWVIADLNGDRFKDPLDIPPGTLLRILK